MRRLTVAEAAEALGITMDAVQMQISRGTLLSEEHEGRVYVLLDDAATHDRSGESEALISELKNRIRFLEEAAATRDEEIRRRDHIIAGLLDRMPPAIEPPSRPPGSTPAPPPASPDRDTVSPDRRRSSSPMRNLPAVLVIGLIMVMLVLAIVFGAMITS
jgi:hypothetical protein